MKRQTRGWGAYIAVVLVLVLLFMYLPGIMNQTDEVSNQVFREALEKDKITGATIEQNKEVPTGSVTFQTEDGDQWKVYVTDVKEAEKELQEAGVDYVNKDVPGESIFLNVILPVILIGFVIILFMNMMSRAASGGGNNSKMMNFGKSRARLSTDRDKQVVFANVAGLKEEKEDLEEVVDFLKNPQKYIRVGARIPKGVLLVGPPGTGKTLLAKAVAGEAGVPFFSISGSDFVEMFVGVGASRVRDLFEEAKRSAPCIIFIDEIDAVARMRGTGMGGGHDEREQTLNQLLVEMDGFGVNEGIIVMAATNRVDILDPAILRPGRFDRRIAVGVPDVQGREEILAVHAKGKPLGDDVNLKQIAQTTAGFTGAELENLLNEAAILAAKEDRAFLKQEDIKDAFIKVGIGTEKKSKIISEKEKKITAYHETGHAILFHVLPDMEPVYTISVIPTGPGAAGYTMPQPENDEMFNTRGKMLQRITVALGGRVAEEMIFDDITTGASQDIKQATAIARAMVTKYGMSARLGLVSYGNDSDEVFIGRDWGHTKSYSESVAADIDAEVRRIIEECHKKAKEIIARHTFVLEKCAKELITKEKLNRDEFEAIFAMEEAQKGKTEEIIDKN
ncbi:MAG TPA: ATP-dependent zinc metalloprotease FtsH [Candidatus Scatomonas merdigallinarum]|nr:ATP-dependent zinc metalloprotease FtsH [Candidatus Scatomonas merdigallinarum]